MCKRSINPLTAIPVLQHYLSPKRWLAILVSVLFIMPATPSVAGTITGTVQCRGVRSNRDVVVAIEHVEGEFPPPTEPVLMDQKELVFIPHVLPIVKGTAVKFLNSDPFAHNVFSPDKVADKINLGTWPQGQSRLHTFQQLGEAVVLCNVHPEMEAWIVVRQNPYFAVTDDTGTYRIDNVPAGTYIVNTWHQKLKQQTQEVTVADTGETVTDFTLSRR